MSRLHGMLDQFWLARHIHTGDLLLFDPAVPRPSAKSILFYNISAHDQVQVWENQLAAVVELIDDAQRLHRALEAYRGAASAAPSKASALPRRDQVTAPKKRKSDRRPKPSKAPPALSELRGRRVAPRNTREEPNSFLEAIKEVRSLPRPEPLPVVAPPVHAAAAHRTPSLAPREPESRIEIIRDLRETERRQAEKAAKRELRRAKSKPLIPDHEEGVPRADWARDEDIRKLRRGYGH